MLKPKLILFTLYIKKQTTSPLIKYNKHEHAALFDFLSNQYNSVEKKQQQKHRHAVQNYDIE